MDYPEEWKELPKRERKRRLKELKKEVETRSNTAKVFKRLFFLVFSLLLLFGAYKLIFTSQETTDSNLLQAIEVPDLGRNHVEDGVVVEYNSDPPTSGPHYADWTRAGVYEKPVSDGHLIHSLEHGYVTISFNCENLESQDQESGLFKSVLAHEEELSQDSSETAEGEALTGLWESEACKNLVESLTGVFEEKGERKLIVIPRPGLETAIALTAWTKLDKFDEFDQGRIFAFIDAFRDKGPEKTAE